MTMTKKEKKRRLPRRKVVTQASNRKQLAPMSIPEKNIDMLKKMTCETL